MSSPEDDFARELRATFTIEAAEHLQAITTGLLALENTPAPAAQRDLIATVFRAAHSLKGAARAVDITAIESLCQSLEDLFSGWKRAAGAPSPATLDPAHRTLDAISAMLATPGVSGGGTAPAVPAHAFPPPPSAVAATPPRFAPAAKPGAAPAPAAGPGIFSSEDTVRITVAKLDARLVEAEELLTAKLSAGQRAEDLRELAEPFAAWRHAWAAVEPDARALRQTLDRPAPGRPASPDLARLLAYFDRNLDHLKSLESRVAAVARTAEDDRLVVGKLVDELLASSKNLLLLPFAPLAALGTKVVHDLCRDLGKEADLVVRGEEVEIDKRIMEEMKDPLVHLLRNCVDHGIEAPAVRVRLGKPARGAITLTVARVDGGKVEILVADDGAGLDLARIRNSAVKHGFLSTDDAGRLDDAGARALIFQAEVSTSRSITPVSGRGLGLAIVREQAEKLGGTVAVESQPGQATRFRLLLPSLLATFRGVLIEVAGRLFVVPTAQVERVAAVRAGDLRTVAGRATIALDERAVALVRLADVLELPAVESPSPPPAATSVMVLGLGDQTIAFTVDVVIDELEVLVKPLPRPLSRVRHIAGATVLGSGRVALILNVADLLKSARKNGGAAARAAPAPPARAPRAKTLLVVEDSITSRTLLKGILESAGYHVKTAVDGLDAFMQLRAEEFDLVVSDVEMPRLNGFDLTTRIRADLKLAQMPVVLVTALQSREDRERGIDVGANAYLVKSNFDQSNLLDAVRRLV